MASYHWFGFIFTTCAGVACAQQHIPVDISGIANTGWNIFDGGGTLPTGDHQYNALPFKIPAGPNNAWIGFGGASTQSVSIPVNVSGATTVYTLMDTVWGQPGPVSYASMTFTGSNGATYTKNLVGNIEIRDFNTPTPFTDSLNKTTTINAWTGPYYDGAHYHRLDEQIIALPAAFSSQALTSITITDAGRDNFQRVILAALTVDGSLPPARISLGSRTIMASGGLGDSNNPPSYVTNPSAYNFVLTDGITTLTGKQRRNNDPMGGPNKDLQAMTTFDGRQLTVSGTVSALSFADTQGVSGGSQFLGIGLVTRGQLDRAAINYNETLSNTPAPGKDGFACICFGWFTDQNGGHLYMTGQDWDGQKNKVYLDLTAMGLANGQSITQPITFSMVFTTSTLALTVNGQSRGSTPISHDLSNVALIASADSENVNDGIASITFADVTAVTPSTVGAPNLIYALSGNGQSDMAGAKLAMPLVIGVVDSYRNPVLGTTVTFTGINATASPSMIQTDANGQASAQISLGNTVGPSTITAIAGTVSATFSFSATGSPGPVVNAVVNGASFVGGGIVPGEIATIFGANLTSSSGINLTSSLPLPSVFLNVSVIVNDPPVPLFAVDSVNGQQQINFQVPWEVVGRSMATVAASNNGVTGSAINVLVLAAQPGIFAYGVGGNSFGAILHANFQLADTGHPALAGETVLIYCTGLGIVNSPPPDGAAGSGQTTVATPTVTIGGANATVSFSGLAPGFVGLYQINAVVPAGLAIGNQPVVITMQGSSSSSALLPVK